MTNEQDKAGAPAGGQTGAPADQPENALVPASQPEETAVERAWKEHPEQVRSAISYADENRYEYGPRLRRAEMDHTVISATEMEGGIVRVTLEYRPLTKFRGQSGTEYLDVAPGGEILARRQLNRPREVTPWLLIGFTAASVIAAAVLVPLILFAGEGTDTTFVSGRTLWVRSDQPKIQPYVMYEALDTEGTDRTWLIVPEGEGTLIAYVNLTVFNQTSGVVNLALDADAAQIVTEEGIRINAVNVFERVRWPAAGAEVNPRYSVLSLPLWGDRTLEAGQQIAGFMAFEVPVGTKISSLRWAATDVANIRY